MDFFLEEELWKQASHHACSPPVCKSRSPNASSALSEPSLKHRCVPVLAPGIQTLFWGMEDKSQMLFCFVLFRFVFLIFLPKPLAGWLGGMLPAPARSAASAECFCGVRSPDPGAPGGSAGFLESIVPEFVCSAAFQQPLGRSRTKGSVREQLPQRGPGKQDCVPWLSLPGHKPARPPLPAHSQHLPPLVHA